MFDRVANLTWNHPKAVIASVVAIVAMLGVLGSGVEDKLKSAGFSDPDSESEQIQQILLEDVGYDAAPGIVLLVQVPNGDGKFDPSDPVLTAEVRRLATELDRIELIARVDNPLAGGSPRLLAEDRRSLLVTGFLETGDENDASDAAATAEETIGSERLDVTIGGYAATFNEVNDTTREDLIRAELIAFPILLILLLVVFRGVIAALLPLAVGGVAVIGTTGGLALMSELTDTSIFALNVATALGLGLAVDYGLLLVSRYREELERSGPTIEAHRALVNTAGRTVMYSGLTVAVAMASLALFPQRFLYSMGAGGAMVALLAAFAAIFLVPAALALLGNRVNALAIRRGPSVSDTSGGWYRLARWVMRRPVATALTSAALLLAAALPLLGAQTTGPSSDVSPPGKPSRNVTEHIRANFPSDIETPISVAVRGDATRGELSQLSSRIAKVDGIEVANPFIRLTPDLALAGFGPAEKALSPRSQDAVREIRTLPAPGEIFVSGNTAAFVDQKESLVSHVPLVFVFVAVSTLLLLFMLTGSVLLPLKTLLMNALTLAATLGLLKLAFQDGLLHAPLGFEGPSALEVSTIVLLFAIGFGLATDYAVLVLARIKELHDRGHDNEEAVALGIGRTGRVITAAALLLSVVFIAFTTSSIFFMKESGLGMALAVLIDASIVRALLVPSLMRLLGDWNWWAPAPLKRFQARFGFQEG